MMTGWAGDLEHRVAITITGAIVDLLVHGVSAITGHSGGFSKRHDRRHEGSSSGYV